MLIKHKTDRRAQTFKAYALILVIILNIAELSRLSDIWIDGEAERILSGNSENKHLGCIALFRLTFDMEKQAFG